MDGWTTSCARPAWTVSCSPAKPSCRLAERGETSVTETTLRAAPHTEAVANGRRLAARTMRTWSLLNVEEAVTAIVAELVANAVRHARTPLELRLLRKPGRVRVEVRDRSPLIPRLHV